jgi:hypothetical protein
VPLRATLCPRASIVMWKMAAVRPLMDSSCTFSACVAARQLGCGPLLGLVEPGRGKCSGLRRLTHVVVLGRRGRPAPEHFRLRGIRRSSDVGDMVRSSV